MRSFLILLAVFLALLWVVVCGPSSTAELDADVAGDFGDPIPGLDAATLSRFDEGRAVFTRRFGAAEGRGPHFNASSCVACHEDPAPGGSSQRYRDFFLVVRDGVKVFPDCTEENAGTHATEPCLPSVVMPHYGPVGAIDEPVSAAVARPTIPDDAEFRALRNAPPIFGVGLFRLVADEEILSREDALDGDGDGISGRANRISSEDGAIGRFGYKCQTASIEAFNRGALHNQMGITSDSIELALDARPGAARSALEELLAPKVAHAQVANPRDRIVDYDSVPDPEITRTQLINLVAFQENLAAPRRGRITSAVVRGATVFEEIGCTGCHVPSLPTPLGLIHPYTDLLVHDMGPELADGISMHDAGGSEFRTQPLWGLCRHAPFLHDGRAETVEEAILAHDGEARAAREGYEGLTAGSRADLHRFLESL